MNNLIPQTDVFFQAARIQQQLAVATHFFNAKCFGGGIANPEQLFVMIQAGAEMGMGPMESVNSLYIVNGNITIYGMAMTKRLREAGWKITYDEKPDEATATIVKGDEVYSYTATAKELAGSRAYKLAPRDKLKWHAIGRLIRFYVPEITGGTIKYIQEEMDDGVDFNMPAIKRELATPVMLTRIQKLAPTIEEVNKTCDLTLDEWNDLTQEDAIKCLTTLISNKKKHEDS